MVIWVRLVTSNQGTMELLGKRGGEGRGTWTMRCAGKEVGSGKKLAGRFATYR